MQAQLILIACVASFGSASSGSYVQAVDQVPIISGKLNHETGVRQNFQNLFNSIANNDAEIGGMYRGLLKEGVANEQIAFDVMKDTMALTRMRNSPRRISNREQKTVVGSRELAKREVVPPIDVHPDTHDALQRDIPVPPTTTTTENPLQLTFHFITIVKIEQAPSYVRQPAGDSKVCRYSELVRLEICKEALQEGFIKGQYKLSKTRDMGRETVYRIQYGGLLSANNDEDTVSACVCPTDPPIFLQDGEETDYVKILIQVIKKAPPGMRGQPYNNDKIMA